MAFILGVVLVPPLLYSFYQAVDAYRERHAQQAAAIGSVLRVIASYEAEFFAKTRNLLMGLAAEPVVRQGVQPGCTERLRQIRSQAWDYTDLVVLDAAGNGICASSPELLAPLGDRAYFARIKAGADFVVSEVVEHRVGQGPVIVAGVPIRASHTGALIGAVSVGINLQTFKAAIDNLRLPEGGVAWLVDAGGRSVADSAPPGKDGGAQRLSPELFYQLLANPGAEVTGRGEDGIERDYLMTDLAGRDLHVIVGIPALAPFSWLERDLVIGIFAPTLMLTLAVVAIWIASDLLVNQHVRTLAAAARAYSRGELDLRLDLASAPTEFQELARTFARMADRLQRREEELKASLAQKELLLREVHHRVKNNLQIVTSLLNLRAQRLASPVARDAVRQAQMRINALALVHRNLYQTDSVQEIELHDFLGELCRLMEEINDAGPGGVELGVEVEPARIVTDQAIPLALLVTEAVSNAFKHAFPADRPGRIELRLTNIAPGRARLAIADDGVGLASADETAGMGVTLMRMLAKQLGGRLEVSEAAGTRIELDFPLTRPESVRSKAAALP